MSTSRKKRIMNEAARHVGAGLIHDIAKPATGTGKSILAFYDAAVEEVLELRGWSGAKKRVSLTGGATIAEGTHSGFNGFTLPADMVRINTVFNHREVDWYVETGVLYSCQAGPIEISYNSRETETYWTAHMIALMGATLGLKASLSRKDSQSKTDKLERTVARLTLKASQLEGGRKGAGAGYNGNGGG